MKKFEPGIIVRGGGDLATGIIHKLTSAGFHLLILECSNPSAIRRTVSFCEAVYLKKQTIEGQTAEFIGSVEEYPDAKSLEEKLQVCFEKGRIPLLIDEKAKAVEMLKPDILVDAIIAKQNLGTYKEMAPLTIGVGPGFTAGEDVHYVIETKRGHNIGRVIKEGAAFPNSGIPGNICGYTKERVMHAPATGRFRSISRIADLVEKGQVIGEILAEDYREDCRAANDPAEACAMRARQGETAAVPVYASLTGILRGVIRENYPVVKGLKIADIDPRKEELANCFTISDKSRSIGGGVLELVSAYARKRI